MNFQLKPDEFFRGTIRQPGGGGEQVVVKKGSRDAAVKHTVRAADEMNWDWVIELLRDTGDCIETLEHWSSVQGDLPPGMRSEVPGLD